LLGWEEKNLTARLTQDVVFPADSRHRVICPNAVVELRKSSVVLERPFEGSTEVFFEVSLSPSPSPWPVADPQ